MEMKANVIFKWQEQSFKGWVEQENQNSYLINVLEPFNEEISEKYSGRMVVSKKHCELLTSLDR